MFEILSTIELTVSASLVIGFLAYAMAETPRGRLTVAGVLAAWFVLVLAIGATRRARSGARARRSRSGPNGRAAGRCARLRLLRCSPRSERNAGDAVARAGRGQCGPHSRGAFCASPRRGQASRAVRAERRLGRHFRRRHGAAPRLVDRRSSARVSRPLVFLWNAIGIADLITAVALGALSARVRFRPLSARRRAPS